MEHDDSIIDVTPVDQSRKQQPGRTASPQTPGSAAGHTAKKPYYTFDGTSWHTGANGAPASSTVPVDAHVIDAGGAGAPGGQPKSRLGGAARIAAGGVCTLVGVPMLILPGPGLLAIGGGIYLMASGAKRLFAK